MTGGAGRWGRVGAALALVLGGAAIGCEPELGELPARCADAEPVCPEGYACVNGVCAEPDAAIPLTLATLQYLRAVDLRVVPQASGSLVAWQLYKYDLEAHDFAAARIDGAGRASPVMTLVGGYPADANYLEPYFDVLPVGDDRLLLAVGAAPADPTPPSRLTQYAVTLPPPGAEGQGATAEARFEVRMRTLGYGAVSRPRLAPVGDGVALAYFESLAAEDQTAGELAVFDLDREGRRVGEVACGGPTCCQADACFPTRDGAAVAVGLSDVLLGDDGVPWWIIDDARPSFVRPTGDEEAPFVASALPRLAVPLEVRGSSLVFLQPSPRGGAGTPDAEVAGPASLWRVTLDGEGQPGAPEKFGDLPAVRDTPRPVWIARADRPGLLVTPGADLASRTLQVLAVDLDTAATTEVAAIDRLADLPVPALQAVAVAGKLHVVWIDERSDAATVRAMVVDEP